MEVLKKSLNIPVGLLEEVEEVIENNPGFTFTLIANQAIKEWLKSPKVELVKPEGKYDRCDPKKRDFIKDLVEVGTEVLDAEMVILFGSQARGDWRKQSDIDILYVVPDDIQNKPKSSKVLLEMKKRGRKIEFDADLMIVKRSRYEKAKKVDIAILTSAVKEGRVVYRRGE